MMDMSVYGLCGDSELVSEPTGKPIVSTVSLVP
jgi:hypothetical protein